MEPFHVGNLAVWHHRANSKQPRARVLLIHGLSEHSGRHLNTIEFLTSKGVEVVRFDLRGAGRSGGRRQWVEKFEDYVHDAAQAFHWIEHNLPPLPLFVLGHSLGGAIAIYYASYYPKDLNGLILTAPAYLVGSAVSPIKIKVGRFLERFVPTMRLPKATDSSSISRDKAICEAFQADPLCCHFNTLRQGNEILKALDKILEPCGKIEVPVLIVHGSMDRLIRLEGSYGLLKAMAAKDKTLHVIPGAYHEPHNDLCKEEFFAVLGQWILDRLRRD